jgi:hypothetical protein
MDGFLVLGKNGVAHFMTANAKLEIICRSQCGVKTGDKQDTDNK